VSGEYKKAEKVKAKTNFSLIANKPIEVKRFTSLILPTDTTISELQKIADKEKSKYLLNRKLQMASG
jgi:cell division protease FtsH